jgi:hypothetical protein
MSFSKFINCCFPRNKNQIIEDSKEESYDIKNTSAEKKVDNCINTGKDNPITDNSPKNNNKQDKENVGGSSQPYLEHKKPDHQMIGSFTSFGFKREFTNNKKYSNKDNKINAMTQMAEKRDNQIEINTNLNMDNNKNYNTILNGKAKNLDKNSRNSFKTNSKKNEESNLDLNSHRIITDEEIKNAPEIFLEEVMGEMLKNNKLLINAAGLTTGLRKARDGLVFFGFSSKNLKNVLKNLIISRDVNLLLMMLN